MSHETLTISSDRRFLLDSTGKKVRQYVESLKSFGPISAKGKDGIEYDPAVIFEQVKFGEGFHIHPCHFHKECIAWDSHGKCTQWVTVHDICTDLD